MRPYRIKFLHRKHYLALLIAVGYSLICNHVWSQDISAAEIKPSIVLITRPQHDRILLRWAINTPMEWKRANIYGFYLDKFVYKRNGERLVKPEMVYPASVHIKAAPLEEWREIIDTDDYAAVIAQALYGEGFEVSSSNDNELLRIVDLSQELEQRFSLALFAADMNFEAAVKAGWGYMDTDVKPGEEYVYRVRTAFPEEKARVKGAVATAGIDNIELLPQPIGLQGIWGDNNVLLTWDYELFKSIYTYYKVERSTDGSGFSDVSSSPVVNLNDKIEAPAKRMYYIDSLPKNDSRFYYRVYGVSPFGEKGPYSEIISGKANPVLSYTPRISGYEFTDNENEAFIQWEYPLEAESDIRKFTLTRSDSERGPYQVIIDSIPVSGRGILCKQLNPANYFKVIAVGKNNQQKESFSALVQVVDSIPPGSPSGLKGQIDSLGHVKLYWNKNTDKDIYGYRVFRRNTDREEFIQLTVDPVRECTFSDSVQIRSLNSKVYYSVIAVDKRFNQSDYSEVLQLEKPDKVPPASPVFSGYKIENGKIELRWERSTEPGVTHILFRKDITANGTWETVFTTMDTTRVYTDKKVLLNHKYRYGIMARDKSGLESEPSTPLTLTVVDLQPKDHIKILGAFADREGGFIELKWKLPNPELFAEVIIYKNVQDQPPVTYMTLQPDKTVIQDTGIHPNNVYTYQILAILKDGTRSKIKKTEIMY